MHTFFQSEEYCALFENCKSSRAHKISFRYRGQAYYFVAIQHKQSAPDLALNPIILDCLQLPDYSTEKQAEILNCIISKLKSHHFLPSTSLQIRNSDQLRGFSSILNDNKFHFSEHLNIKLDTSDGEACWKKLSAQRKKQIRKGLQQGAIISQVHKETEVLEFYSILKSLYQKGIKKQFPPLRLFIKFLELSEKGNRAKLFSIRYEDKIIGGSICPVDPSMKIYEWYICGLDKEFRNVFPSVLATWAPIKYACENNIPIFDFMGAGRPSVPYGVRDFKKKFGGTLINTGRFVCGGL